MKPRTFGLDISQPDVSAEGQAQENPYAPKSMTDKLGSYFKTVIKGTFNLTRPNSHCNLRAQQTVEGTKLREEHQVMVATLQNRVVMLHSNPLLGKIFMYELDPSQQYRYQQQVRFRPNSLIRMQVVDNLVLVHNLDDKHSQMYDFKVVDYSAPLLKANLQVQPVMDQFCSDMYLAEEKATLAEANSDPNLAKDTTVEINFAVKYSSDSNEPVKAEVTVPPNDNPEEEKKETSETDS